MVCNIKKHLVLHRS